MPANILGLWSLPAPVETPLCSKGSGFEGEVGCSGNADDSSSTRGELIHGGALHVRAAPEVEILLDGGVALAVGRRRGADGPRGGAPRRGVPVARPAVLGGGAATAAAAAAAAGRRKQLLETGAKLLAEEAVDVRIDAAVGRARPLSYRHYHLYDQRR